MIESFVNYMKAEKMSENTMRGYTNHINQMLKTRLLLFGLISSFLLMPVWLRLTPARISSDPVTLRARKSPA